MMAKSNCFSESARLVVQAFWFFPVVFILSAAPAPCEVSQSARLWFLIEEESSLYLAGTSNVNKFSCRCEDRYERQTLDYSHNSGYVRFQQLYLTMRTDHFDCHNRKIDADLQKALKSKQYPYIKVAFSDAGMDLRCFEKKCSGWFPVKINTEITITDVTKKVFMDAEARINGANQIQLRGSKPLYMSQFGVSPPEAMFGMIKVNDLITFHFDLKIQIIPQ